MKCHYEVLNIPREAENAEIKAAYRKLALKWHPDKNLDNPDLAKEQFQFVQQAYEVLSDKQERAWYDSHREQIIRGASSEFQDNSLNVFQYFTTTCFKGYGDDEKGFYGVYRTVFEKIGREDMEFMEDKEEFCEVPGFGTSESDSESVAEFYAYWSHYLTKKSYVWLDPYDIKDIKERRYVKLVEKENKKVRTKAKKERNEEVRNLVAFVRKRDKRVQAQKKVQEQKLLEDKKKREELSKQKRKERQQMLNESGSQPEWAKFDNVKSELEEIEKSLAEQFGEELSNSESEEEDLNNLYCVACNKVFKTTKAFQNHESSKKHKENIELLKHQMLEEEEESVEGDSNVSDEIEDYGDLVEDNKDDIDKVIEDSILKEAPSESEDLEVDDMEEIETKPKRKKKQQKTIPSVKTDVAGSPEIRNGAALYSDDEDFDFGSGKKQKKKNKKNGTKPKPEPLFENGADKDVPGELRVVREGKKNKKEKKNRTEETSNDLGEIDLNHNCVTCKSNFSSKNKLFDHLKKTGHGVYIPSNTKSRSKKHVREK